MNVGGNISTGATMLTQDMSVNGRFYFRNKGHSDDSDPYYIEKLGGHNDNHLRLTINDDNNESFQIWGASCTAGNCGGEGGKKHVFDAMGNAEHVGNLGVGGDAELGGPSTNTRITRQGIIFGGANNGREANSAQISAGKHEADSLCIVGMSRADHSNRKITMWSEGGMKLYGRLFVDGRDILAELDDLRNNCVRKNTTFRLMQKNSHSNSDQHVRVSDAYRLVGAGGADYSVGEQKNFYIQQ
jgi:hypothetical protein